MDSNQLPAERARQDLLQRLLATAPDEEETDSLLEPPEEMLEVLVFQLGSERFGMEIQHVAEIVRYKESTAVPHTVNYLEGIVSLRGKMIPVINGRKRLGQESKPPDKKTRIIVVHAGSELHGLLVDSATQVVRLPKKNLEPTPPVVTAVNAEFLEGVCRHKDQIIILLNLRRFLEFV